VFFESQPRKPNTPLEHEKSYTIDNTSDKTELHGIDARDFEKTYAILCTELNQDFNLHMLPRYSMGRRETMSKPSNSNNKLSNLRKSLYHKSCEKDTSPHYSSRKEIDNSVVDDADEIPPDLPPKFRHSDKSKQASKIQDSTEECTIPSSPDNAPFPENYVKDESSAIEQNSFQTRSYTIEKSCNIQLLSKKVSENHGGEELTEVTTDPIQLDLRTLATSFSLSQKDNEVRRKISKDDFDLKARRNLSLNEMKKTKLDKT
jgi:hypothetical protein